MSVQHLTDAHFSNAGGGVLRCNLPGITFIMFKTEKCGYCKQTMPILNTLAQQDRRVTYAIIDVGQFRHLITMAKTSNTPIRSVPMFILYIEGKPHANYKGERSVHHIRSFLNKILSTINTSSQSFSQPAASPSTSVQTAQPQLQQNDDELHLPNVIPHNAPYLAYKQMNNTYKVN